MSILNGVFEKLGSGMDHVGGALDKLLSSHITYTGQPEPVVAPTPQIDPRVSNLASAIAHNETRGVKGDPYLFSQYSGSTSMGKALGRYQTTEGELKTWGHEFLGETIDPQKYSTDSKLQDKYVHSKISALIKAGASDGEILALQRGGLTGYADPKIRAKKLEERKKYVDSGLAFLKTLGETKSK